MSGALLSAAEAFLLGAALLALAGAAAYLAVGYYFYRFAVARTKKRFLADDPALPKKAQDLELEAWWETVPFREERLRSSDGLSLYARILPAPEPNGIVALLVHGYSGTGKLMRSHAKLFRTLFGCDIVIPDLRGHGESEGSYIGFGLDERKDIELWIDWIRRNLGEDSRIVLLGVSMGAATVCGVLGDDLPPNVRCAVSDCSYSTARDALAHKLKTLFKLPPFPILPAAELITRILAGYRIADASPAEALSRAKVPLLIIHGEDDEFVPPRMAKELYEAAACPKELFMVPGAGHARCLETEPESYAARIAAFVGPKL